MCGRLLASVAFLLSFGLLASLPISFAMKEQAGNGEKQKNIYEFAEFRDKRSICEFGQCTEPYLPIEDGKIGVFPIPRFTLGNGQCTGGMPNPNNLIITPAKFNVLSSHFSSFGKICNSIFFCYASAFEGKTKNDFWSMLKVKNIKGNIVTEMCNKGNDGFDGVVWHGFAIFHDIEVEHGHFILKEMTNSPPYIGEIKYFNKFYVTDTMLFSFSSKKIQLDRGNFFFNLKFSSTDLKPTVATIKGAFYTAHREDHRYKFDGENEATIRPDLVEVNMESPYEAFHQFNFDASLWTIPYDMAVLNAKDYGISYKEDEPKPKILLMKVVDEGNCAQEYIIDAELCKFNWAKVEPSFYNLTYWNGKTLNFYTIKVGFLMEIANIFKKFKWSEIKQQVEKKFPSDYKQFYPESKNVKIADEDFKFEHITKEQYEAVVMMFHVNCIYAELLYGFAKFAPDLAPAKTMPNLDWSKEFDLFTGCKQELISLSNDFTPDIYRKRTLDQGPVVHDGFMFVGIEGKKGVEFTLDKNGLKALDFYLFNSGVDFTGQYILPRTDIYVSNKKYRLLTQFRAINPDMLKKMGYSAKAIKEDKWKNDVVEFDVVQETFDCPKMIIRLPRVSGQISKTVNNNNGKLVVKIYQYGPSRLLGNENPVDWFEMHGGGKQCRINVQSSIDLSSDCKWVNEE